MEDILTKEIESWKGFADSLQDVGDRTTFTKMLNGRYKYAKAINANVQPFPSEPVFMALLCDEGSVSGRVKKNCSGANPDDKKQCHNRLDAKRKRAGLDPLEG